MQEIQESLHKLEAQMIEIEGLIQALQRIMPDGATHTCVANAIDKEFKSLQENFADHWHMIAKT